MKFIDIEKQTKKAQKNYFKKYRNNWSGVNPITKKIESKKIYNRTRKINDWKIAQKNNENFVDNVNMQNKNKRI